ncbi:C-type lectin domain family 2 member E-like isoform X3 [Lissotriton helveticus]
MVRKDEGGHFKRHCTEGLTVVHIRWTEDQKMLKDCVQSSVAETGKYSEVLPPCDYGWIWYRNKCFHFSDDAGDWMEAKDSCAALNSSLAMIDTQKELEFLLRHKGDPDLWIGLSRRDLNHPWIWVDGTKFNNWFKVEDYAECAYLSHHIVRSSECYSKQKWICSKYPLKKAQ